MKLRALGAVVGFVCALAAGPAMGQFAFSGGGQTRGWYVGLEGGWSHLGSFNDRDSRANLKFHTDTSEGFVGGGNGGYNFGRVRVEAEMTFREQEVDRMKVVNGGTTFPSLTGKSNLPGGNVGNTSLMLNAMVDLLPLSNWTPYIGAGIGRARIALNSFSVAHTNFVNKSDTQFAYQGILGARYQLAEHYSLNLDYRYFATTDPDFKDLKGVPFLTPYATHNVVAGFTYHFGGPKPAPSPPRPPAPTPATAAAPAAAPAPLARTFLVFFDFDKSNITAASARVIDEAVASFREAGAARIQIAGYTDLAGSAEYNLKLSKRRADAVRAELVKRGVPDTAVAESWFGKQNPRVPTPDGVREAQNRRVEIVIP